MSEESWKSGNLLGAGDGCTVVREPGVLLSRPSWLLNRGPGMRTGTAGQTLGLAGSSSSGW